MFNSKQAIVPLAELSITALALIAGMITFIHWEKNRTEKLMRNDCESVTIEGSEARLAIMTQSKNASLKDVVSRTGKISTTFSGDECFVKYGTGFNDVVTFKMRNFYEQRYDYRESKKIEKRNVEIKAALDAEFSK